MPSNATFKKTDTSLNNRHSELSRNRKFTGWWIPAKIVKLLDEGLITGKEMIVLSIITNYHESPLGCFVTNESLCKELSIQPRRLLKLLCNLKSKGFLITKKYKDGRGLVPVFKKSKKGGTGDQIGHPARWPNWPPRGDQIGHPEVIKLATPSHSVPPPLKRYSKLNNTVSRLASARTGGGFFKTSEYSEDEYSKWTKILHDALLKKNLLQKSIFDCKKWNKEFHQLKVKDQFKKERIEEVLTWYCANIGEDYIPIAYSAKTFCSKFLQIESSHKRKSSGVNKDLESLSIEDVDPVVQEIYTDLISQYDWSSRKDQLLVYVNVSFLEYKKLFQKMTKLQTATKSEEFHTFVERAKEGYLTFPRDFIWRWWCKVGAKLGKWKEYEGSLAQFRFHLDHKDFLSKGREWAVTSDGSTRNWNKLIK